MQLIILRGLPGCGKSVITEKLEERCNSSVIFGDTFKRSFMNQNPGSENKEIYQYAYDKIFEKIKELFEGGNEIVIVEELFNDRSLVEKIQSFCKERQIEIKSFFIERDLEKLLEVERNRERKIKNTREDFEKLEQEMKRIEIEGEFIVGNNGTIENSVDFILKAI